MKNVGGGFRVDVSEYGIKVIVKKMQKKVSGGGGGGDKIRTQNTLKLFSFYTF